MSAEGGGEISSEESLVLVRSRDLYVRNPRFGSVIAGVDHTLDGFLGNCLAIRKHVCVVGAMVGRRDKWKDRSYYDAFVTRKKDSAAHSGRRS